MSPGLDLILSIASHSVTTFHIAFRLLVDFSELPGEKLKKVLYKMSNVFRLLHLTCPFIHSIDSPFDYSNDSDSTKHLEILFKSHL